MDSKDKIWILMSRSLSGELSAEEEVELQLIFTENPEIYQHYDMLRKLWNKSLIKDSEAEAKTEKSRFKNIISRAEVQRSIPTSIEKPTLWPRLYSPAFIVAYAASLALIVALYIGLQPINKPAEQDRPGQVVAAQNGSRSKVLLPDGSTVWLNGGSKLYYDFEVSAALREVKLEGEAFFDVAKDKSRPFIVHAGKIDIKVHGTAFNVKCYKEDDNIETTLLHGKIEVSDIQDRAKPHVFLSPNEKLIIPVKELEKTHAAAKVDLVKLDSRIKEKERIETAWIYNRIEFRGENFDDLARKLERWYNVDIEFQDEEVKLLTFNGSFERETVDEAFKALGRVANFKYEIKGRKILIKSYE